MVTWFLLDWRLTTLYSVSPKVKASTRGYRTAIPASRILALASPTEYWP